VWKHAISSGDALELRLCFARPVFPLQRIVKDPLTGVETKKLSKPCPAEAMCGWMTYMDADGSAERQLCTPVKRFLKPV
jgi:hypothetical protein